MGFFVYATYDVSDLADADGNFLRGFSADGETLDSIREVASAAVSLPSGLTD